MQDKHNHEITMKKYDIELATIENDTVDKKIKLVEAQTNHIKSQTKLDKEIELVKAKAELEKLVLENKKLSTKPQ